MLQNSPVLYYLLAAVLLYWLMLMFASTTHTRLWTWTGLLLAVGNRDQMPERSVLMARADRAAKNMAENLMIFAVVVLTAVVAGAPREQSVLGGQVFLYARVLYWPLYLAGVIWVRTMVWAIALFGVGIIAAGIFQIRFTG